MAKTAIRAAGLNKWFGEGKANHSESRWATKALFGNAA
jgi:hypothetical protein